MVVTILAFGLLFVLGGASFWAARAADVEEPQYRLLPQEAPFELRLYGPTIEARTTLGDDSRTSMSRGFRRLAGYIFGGNDQSQSIAMTAPVSRFRQGQDWKMSFTMPSEWQLENLPKPLRKDVSLIAVEGQLVAALRFPGWARPKLVERKEQQLLALIQESCLEAVGPRRLAQYDPPSQLPPLRRNEILIPVQRACDEAEQSVGVKRVSESRD